MKTTLTNPIFYALILLAALIYGCASTPTTPIDNPAQLTKTASSTLSTAVYTNTLFSECSRLGGDAEIEAITVQQSWLDKNWAAISAADNYYSEQFQHQAIDFQNKKITLAAVQLSHKAQEKAQNELNLKQRTGTNQQLTCVRRLKTIVDDGMALTKNSQEIVDLQTLTAKYVDGSSADVTPVPSLAGDINLRQEPGRSYFVLVEQFKQTCPNAEFIVLHNRWPQEAYGAFCKNSDSTLFVCEWGKCTK